MSKRLVELLVEQEELFIRKDGKGKIKVVPIGRPILVSKGNDSLDHSLHTEIKELAPETANSYVLGAPNSSSELTTYPIQFYRIFDRKSS